MRIAYEEAKKWNANAVLWFINPTDMFLHYDWTQTDKAMSWTIGFANPDNDEEVQVYVRDGKVNPIGGNPVDNVGNKRKVECKPEYPKDSPKISMKQAAQVAIENGAPAGVMPVNVSYDTESFEKAGSPLWMIVYSLPVPTDPQKQEMHFYYVDGLTGKFVEAGYRIDRTIVKKEQLSIKGPDYASSTVWMDQTNMIVKFLTLVNEGKATDAVAMLDKQLGHRSFCFPMNKLHPCCKVINLDSSFALMVSS